MSVKMNKISSERFVNEKRIHTHTQNPPHERLIPCQLSYSHYANRIAGQLQANQFGLSLKYDFMFILSLNFIICKLDII